MINMETATFYFKICFVTGCAIILALTFGAGLSFCYASENQKEAGRFADDFQRQMPWSRQIPQSGAINGMLQPENYISPSESMQPKSEQLRYAVPYYYYQQYPLCYNPYLFRYEYCGGNDSYEFRVRFRSKDFIFWWENKRECPPGHRFVHNRGCYRY